MSKEDDRSEFEKRLQQERTKELKEMSKGEIDLSNFKRVNESLGDKIVAQQSDFTAKGKKQSGVSAGYIASQAGTNETFILKHFYKTHADCLSEPNNDKRRQAISDRHDGVREVFGSTMYQFLLYDRAPKEELVTPNKDNPKSLYVRSKFFKDVLPMAEFSSGYDSFEPRSSKLKKVEGFEKLVASCHMLGEYDYHANNIMVQAQKDEQGKDQYVFTKIDHGRSLASFNQDFGVMIDKTAKTFRTFSYDAAIKRGNLSFNIDKFSEGLTQMTSQFSADQIDAIVDQKVAELKKAGFDPKGLDAIHTFGPLTQATSKPITSFEELASSYKDLLKKNLSNMQEISKQTEIITKFTDVDEKFKNGGWLEAFANSPFKDPVAYAAHHNIKIDGKEAVIYAIDKNIKIDGQDPVNYAFSKDIKIEGKGSIGWAHENKYKSKHTTGKEQTSKEKTIEVQEKQWHKGDNGKWHQGNNDNRPELVGTVYKNEVKILDPLAYINEKKDAKFSENNLVPLIDSFVKEHLTSKNDSKEKVSKFYDKVLDRLKKENYITDKEIQNMKTPAEGEKSSEFDKAVNNTLALALLTANTSKIEGSDKMKYGIANFCKKIGCTGLSNYFMKKISPDNLTKIHNAEKAVSESIKLNELLKKQLDREGSDSKRIGNIQSKATEKIEQRAQKQKEGGMGR